MYWCLRCRKKSIQLTEKPCGTTKCEKKEVGEKMVVCIENEYDETLLCKMGV
jgi:hypothetical protein